MNGKVIITADDYGVCDRIDKGIDDAILNKKITAVSFIVTHDGWQNRLTHLKSVIDQVEVEGHKVGIGLHFCITSGKPQAQNPDSTLFDPENKTYFRRIYNYNFKAIDRYDLRQELDAQITELKNAIGLENIDHLTNHHGVVYFQQELFEEFAMAAARFNVPIRSPMSWYRKFKKFQELPDFDKDPIINPTMERGIKIGMWRKLSKMSYGNFLKRMNTAEVNGVKYPDVLCEYLYGQCHPLDNDGKKVLDHVLTQFITEKRRDAFNSGSLLDKVKIDRRGIKIANEFTVKKSRRSRNPVMTRVAEKYEEKIAREEFVIELMFHLAKAGLPDDGYDKDNPPHGIYEGYFNFRDGELQALLDYKWEQTLEFLELSDEIRLSTFKEM
ncbi:MAG: ChbG/HpnK family deacetylase [Crocinitomicaceae bacterium]|nr:ChbG/HpnK family deacetylase [Crocinitomicaceae bacterium]